MCSDLALQNTNVSKRKINKIKNSYKMVMETNKKCKNNAMSSKHFNPKRQNTVKSLLVGALE